MTRPVSLSRRLGLCLACAGLMACAGPVRAQRVGDLEVLGAWVRPTVAGQNQVAAYLTVRNHGKVGDRLVGVISELAERAELHNMTMDGDIMRMRPLESVEVPAGRTVKLAPGGIHVMLIGTRQALRQGDTVPAVLQFEKAGKVAVQLRVDTGPTTDAAHRE